MEKVAFRQGMYTCRMHHTEVLNLKGLSDLCQPASSVYAIMCVKGCMFFYDSKVDKCGNSDHYVPSFSPSPVPFFSPFLPTFRPGCPEVIRLKKGRRFTSQNTVLDLGLCCALDVLLLHSLQYCGTGLFSVGPFSQSLRHHHIQSEGSGWVFLGSWMKPDRSLNSLLV